MPSQKSVELTLVADFAPHLDGREIVSVGVGPDNETLVLAATPEVKEVAQSSYVQEGWASFPRSKVPTYQAGLLKFASDFHGELTLEIEEAHPFVQPLPKGEVLVVAARCHYRDGAPERNAAVYGWDGRLKGRFVMGDGLEHVLVAPDGSIWAGYFDEGVFGNYGWENPLGSAGVLRFDTEGEVVWRFEPSADYDMIADCYAFNVATDAVWTCSYVDFPIVRIESDGRRRSWRNEFTGARAITSDNARVLLFGGYSGERTRCVIQDLGNDKTLNSRTVQLVLPEEGDLERTRAYGRGPVLHFFVNTSWYQLDLAQHDI